MTKVFQILEECPYEEHFYVQVFSNPMEKVYNKCYVRNEDIVKKDPMHLLEKNKETKVEWDSWKYDLFAKIQISDATTEVSFIE